MENYLLLALIVILFFVAGFVVYMLVSSKQIEIESEIDNVNALLDEKPAD